MHISDLLHGRNNVIFNPLMIYCQISTLLKIVWTTHHRAFGLVHPMASEDEGALKPITKEYIKQIYDDPEFMSC